MGFLKRLLGKTQTSPKIGDGRRVYAVGDIHGRLDLLNRLLEEITAHAARQPQAQNVIVFLGDYIDRGPDSRGVIERLASLTIADWQIVCLRGNHDQVMLDFVADPLLYRAWRNYGAQETLLSYGIRPPLFDRDEDFITAHESLARVCPAHHWRFLSSLRHFHVEGDYVFVHAGLRPGLSLADQVPEDMLWIREEFLSHRQKFTKMVVHGHTPSPAPVKSFNRICVDTGAHATNVLSAAVLEGETCEFLSATGVTMPAVAPAPLTQHRLISDSAALTA